MEINGRMTCFFQSFVSVRISVLGIPTRDTHFTRDLGMGIPKTREYPNHCDTAIFFPTATVLGNLSLSSYFRCKNHFRRESFVCAVRVNFCLCLESFRLCRESFRLCRKKFHLCRRYFVCAVKFLLVP